MSKKFYIAGGYHSYGNWLTDMGMKEVLDPDKADIVMFAGGTDVGAKYYGETSCGRLDQPDVARDLRESNLIRECIKLGKPMIGVCRGSQFLTCFVKNDKDGRGRLVQDMRHPSYHKVTLYDGREIQVNSSHHNQWILEPSNTGLVEGEDFELLAWANKLSPFHINQYGEDYKFPAGYREPEIAYYPKIKAVAIQGHPERGFSPPKEMVEFCQDVVGEKIGV